MHSLLPIEPRFQKPKRGIIFYFFFTNTQSAQNSLIRAGSKFTNEPILQKGAPAKQSVHPE
jgi:hypothetical protein